MMTDQRQKSMREKVLKRDNYECQFCKILGVPRLTGVFKETDEVFLEIHHKRYPARNADDLITVCKPCHRVITGYVRRHRANNAYTGLVLEDTCRLNPR